MTDLTPTALKAPPHYPVHARHLFGVSGSWGVLHRGRDSTFFWKPLQSSSNVDIASSSNCLALLFLGRMHTQAGCGSLSRPPHCRRTFRFQALCRTFHSAFAVGTSWCTPVPLLILAPMWCLKRWLPVYRCWALMAGACQSSWTQADVELFFPWMILRSALPAARTPSFHNLNDERSTQSKEGSAP
jgi:hypothetical protein